MKLSLFVHVDKFPVESEERYNMDTLIDEVKDILKKHSDKTTLRIWYTNLEKIEPYFHKKLSDKESIQVKKDNKELDKPE